MELIGNDAIATVVAIVWLVGITNAFNLLDNMDGLAATLAAVACGYFAVDAATAHENDVVARAGALPRLRVPRLPALQSAAGAAGGRLHG